MTDIRDRLRDADPLLTEPPPSAADVAALRRRVLAAAQDAHVRVTEWKRTMAIAAAVALVAGVGIDTARRTERRTLPASVTAAPAAAATTRTQLHFATPGGTRIIWTIDPAFQLTEKR